jgi:cobalt-zinc-cadmium efflux system outer membrane protein
MSILLKRCSWKPRIRSLAGVAAAWLLASPAGARADEPALTRARVVELARAAPAARVAGAETAVAGAAVAAAGALSLENPVVSGMGGLRFNPDGTRPFSGVATLSWPVDLGGQPGARDLAARAEHRAASASAEETRRRVLLAALLQHALVLRDERQLGVAAARRALGQRLATAAAKRRIAGSAPEIDVALTRIQESQDASAEAMARGARDADKASLLALLGSPATDPPVEGTLVPAGDVPPLPVLLQAVDQRTDVRAAAAALDAAGARASRERAGRWPTISVLAQYERDDGANIGLLGVAVPLPVLNANRSGVATSAAEVGAAGARAKAAAAAAAGEIRQLYLRYVAARQALEALAPTAALVKQVSELSARSYELGEADLAGVLLVRREAVAAAAALVEAELALASAKIELLVAVGRVPQ